MKVKIEYEPTGINNFHNRSAITLIATKTDDGRYTINKGQAKRLEKHFCGFTECRCPAGAADQLEEDGSLWELNEKWISI